MSTAARAKSKFPLQPMFIDEHGSKRFVMNRIVRDLLDAASAAKIMDLNTIAQKTEEWMANGYTKEEQQQFAQLIGYSLDGYSELQSYVTDGAYAKAVEASKKARRA